jgi:UDP-N-acetylglucosamine 3-dehydrogenase
MDTIIHDFDWLRYAFGDPERVYCQNLRRTDCIDYSQVTFRMKNGMVAYTTGAWAYPSGFRVAVEVCGDGGMLTFTSDDVPIQAMLRREAGHGGGAIIPESPVPESPYALEWGDFVQWIEGRGEPKVKPEDAVWAVRMALGALESAESGQPVTF